MKNILLRIAAIIPLLAISIYVLPAKGMNMPAVQYPLFQKGMSYVTWSKDAFMSPSSDKSIKAMADAGITSVSIVVTWYQQKYNSLDIERTDRTPSDESLKHVIKKAHEYGMSVMLKPHIDLISDDGNTRSDIGFNSEEKWSEWFSNYLKFITYYAALANDEGVEFLCIGTELTFATTKTSYWKDIILPEIKKVFRGHLMYAANWDEYDNVKFWDALDYVGIDAYFPLANKNNPSIDELRQGWKKWLGDIEEFQRKVKKPVVFTECGYASSGSAAAKPWEDGTVGIPDTELQAKCYNVLFETFWDKPWFFGIYWWNWNTYPGSGGIKNKGFTPQNKPALEYITTWYNKLTGEKLAFIIEEDKNLGDTEVAERIKMRSAKSDSGNIKFTGELAGKKDYESARER